MAMIWPVPFVLLVAGVVANAVIAIRMQLAVNEGVPKDRRLSWYGMYGDARKILRRHKSHFPKSHLRQWWYFSILFVLAVFSVTGIVVKMHKG